MIDPRITTPLIRQTHASILLVSVDIVRPPLTTGLLRVRKVRYRSTPCQRSATECEPEHPGDARAVYRQQNDQFCRSWPGSRYPRGGPRRRLRGADSDSGADDPAAARRLGRDRSGPDRLGQDGRVRVADAPVRRSFRAGGARARADADTRALHSGDAGVARVRQTQGRRCGRGIRRRADPQPAGAIARRWAHRCRHGGTGQGPDLSAFADAARLPRRGARRGRRDARPRASWRTSSGSSRSLHPVARRRCSPRRCRRRSAGSPTSICTTR